MAEEQDRGQDFRWSADKATAIAATVVATSALIVSIWQGCETRRHNRLSVTPHLDIFLTSEFDNKYGVLFDNAGIGPARILKYKILVDSEVYTEQDMLSGRWRREGLGALGLSDVPVSSTWLMPGDAVIVGRRRFILSIPSNSPAKTYATFHNALSRVSVVIKYESFYGDTYVAEWAGDGTASRRSR